MSALPHLWLGSARMKVTHFWRHTTFPTHFRETNLVLLQYIMHIDVAFLRRLQSNWIIVIFCPSKDTGNARQFQYLQTETRIVAEIFIWLTTLWGDSAKGLENLLTTSYSRDGSTTAMKVGCYFHIPCSIVTL